MRYGFELSEDCVSCKFRESGFFCQFSPLELKDFDSITSIGGYPAGTVLFMQEQPARGIFQLCQGEVRLSLNSSKGKRSL